MHREVLGTIVYNIKTLKTQHIRLAVMLHLYTEYHSLTGKKQSEPLYIDKEILPIVHHVQKATFRVIHMTKYL